MGEILNFEKARRSKLNGGAPNSTKGETAYKAPPSEIERSVIDVNFLTKERMASRERHALVARLDNADASSHEPDRAPNEEIAVTKEQFDEAIAIFEEAVHEFHSDPRTFLNQLHGTRGFEVEFRAKLSEAQYVIIEREDLVIAGKARLEALSDIIHEVLDACAHIAKSVKLPVIAEPVTLWARIRRRWEGPDPNIAIKENLTAYTRRIWAIRNDLSDLNDIINYMFKQSLESTDSHTPQ